MGIISSIMFGNDKKRRKHNFKKKKQYYKKQYSGGQRHAQSSYGQRYPQTQTNFANPTPRFPTLKGELVRSLSEKYIADFLFMHHVAYEYERPLSLEAKTVHPDFYLPTYGIYVEFWGLLDRNHPDYWESFKWKVDQYEKHRVKFIPLLNEDLPKLDTVFGVKLRQAIQAR